MKNWAVWLKVFIFSGVLTLLVSLLAYSVGQQVLRTSANDPQISMVEDAAIILKTGVSPVDLVGGSSNTDMANSLDPFFIFYDNSGKVQAGTAQLNKQTPILPAGVLDNVNKHGQDRFTWQPQKGVRIAAVVGSYSSGTTTSYILAGRSLREVEKRENNMLYIAGAAWLVFLVVGALLSWLLFGMKKKQDEVEVTETESDVTVIEI